MPYQKEDIIKKIGSNIRSCRKDKQISIEKLALEAGLDYSQICRIERGIINTSVYQLYLISKTLDVPIITFFTEI
ncbi:helix-turn-helix protein [Arcticibacter tournemirensis]|uniref:Helix-turn-helix transcriptional regulator n=1 Tax=Arcticibacter tournemirensis TaxID=699437 RepID=A0A5M9HKC1_9SPHI|nr:helix-turn-helix transcriptional regulator [Arcticibacter tournemirensis]TQM46873.1 helix-turn-helix protein [Arcticibacter tournemirensis]